jgi:hypothetical protein
MAFNFPTNTKGRLSVSHQRNLNITHVALLIVNSTSYEAGLQSYANTIMREIDSVAGGGGLLQ